MSRFQHILVVDKEPEIGAILRTVLETIGYRTSVATGDAEARSILLLDPVDLLVADVGLKSNAGIAMANHVGKLGIPCLLISADVERMETLQAGHHRFIAKPFRLAQFTELVVGLLANKSKG